MPALANLTLLWPSMLWLLMVLPVLILIYWRILSKRQQSADHPLPGVILRVSRCAAGGPLRSAGILVAVSDFGDARKFSR